MVRSAILLLALLVAVFGALYALWLSGRTDAYFAVMHFLCVDAFTRPFLDTTGVLSMGECHRLGIDVTKANPCDPLNRLLNYGPPLLQLPFRTADTAVLGPLQDLMLLIAMAFVLRPRTRGEFAVAALGSLSCGVIYALERGNLDAFEFVLIALSGPLTMRGPTGRLISYALYCVGGALKFYPFALLLTVLRERFMVALGLGVAGVAFIALYAFIYRHNLAAIGAAMPPFEYNGDVFGAACLPFGLADWLGLPDTVGDALLLILTAGCAALAWRLAVRIRGTLRFDGLNFHYLLAGAIVLIGCFASRPSITYRCIFLLLLLPGFFDLRRTPALRRLFTAAIAVVLLCLWSEFVRQWGEHTIDWIEDQFAPDRPDTVLWDSASIAFFIGRELLWWWLVAAMAAIVGVFVLDSPAMQGLRRLIRPAATPRGGTS